MCRPLFVTACICASSESTENGKICECACSLEIEGLITVWCFLLLQVIYAQTDSVFVHFPSANPAEAVSLGQQVAQLVTTQLPPPIELKYERVMSPFLLLHVNR